LAQSLLSPVASNMPLTRDSRKMLQTDNSKKQPFLFVDPQSAQIFSLACRVAASTIPVLITGPTGSGKEILAKVIHEASPQSSGGFIAVNCAAIPATLAESLFFGHEKGTFTGAGTGTTGYFEQANNGTLFLDEIGEMPIDLQPKILRALQEKKITRLGGTREISVNVRIVAATNVNLLEEAKKHRFREDLYYRLSAFKFNMPPLSRRPLDIRPLAYLMIQKYDTEGLDTEISQGAMDKLLSHAWPGNIRELENVIARALILRQSTNIEQHDIVFDEYPPSDTNGFDTVRDRNGNTRLIGSTDTPSTNLPESIQHVELSSILSALNLSGSRADAAKRLGISQRTLRHKLRVYRSKGHHVPDAYAR
jgi:two-component system, response regulator FlrC